MASAFVTGFIFYFIIDFIHNEQKRVSIFRHLNNCVYHVRELSRNLITQICVTMEMTEDTDVDLKQFDQLCDKIKIHHTISHIWDIGKIRSNSLVVTVMFCGISFRGMLRRRDEEGFVSVYFLLVFDETITLCNSAYVCSICTRRTVSSYPFTCTLESFPK